MRDHSHHSLKNHSPPQAAKTAHVRELRLYLIAFTLSLFAGAIEIAVRYLLSNSVSLFGDAAHGIADGSTYGLLALVLIVSKHYSDMELPWTKAAVFVSFLLLFFGDYLVFSEAIERFFDPQEVLGWWTCLTAGISLVLNGIVVLMMYKIPKHEHNIRHDSMLFHALSDAWVSAGVIASAAIIAITNWYAADWIMAFIIAFYLLFLLCVLAIRIVRGDWKIGHDHDHSEHEHSHEDHH
ncbi:MAG: cation diffusion facilitator family transporter [Candidatus Paceibacterota bacterium]|jgi:cobalt-zinc-cadmium efflux system protein|nr:cation diffusion facilitator family transporter [Candidatus Paceibacterota bacterium]